MRTSLARSQILAQRQQHYAITTASTPILKQPPAIRIYLEVGRYNSIDGASCCSQNKRTEKRLEKWYASEERTMAFRQRLPNTAACNK
ncbi:hypothetical protein NDU88_006271 [Pleurodeles waltl]|uniref:Uncharacterized protein n=1 Tax=Pleurodeles waltl TaxID=8319 RepID=A0AAV7ULG4_PLEWA|nr:hypothetical protein NDU88_006271 [Pleurodeles waltl]